MPKTKEENSFSNGLGEIRHSFFFSLFSHAASLKVATSYSLFDSIQISQNGAHIVFPCLIVSKFHKMAPTFYPIVTKFHKMAPIFYSTIQLFNYSTEPNFAELYSNIFSIIGPHVYLVVTTSHSIAPKFH